MLCHARWMLGWFDMYARWMLGDAMIDEWLGIFLGWLMSYWLLDVY